MFNTASVCQLNWSRYSVNREMDTPKFVPAEWLKKELEKPENERDSNLRLGSNW